jgi:hypothetical protein
MKKEFNTFYVQNDFCTSGKRIDYRATIEQWLMWRALIEYINTHAGDSVRHRNGTDVGCWYGLLDGVTDSTSVYPGDEMVYQLDDIISKLNITVQNAEDYVKTYNGNVILENDAVLITSAESSYTDQWAQSDEVSDVSTRYGGGTALSSECNWLYGHYGDDYHCFVACSQSEYDIHWSSRDEEYVCADDSYVHYGVYNNRGNEGWFRSDDYVYTEDTERYFYDADVAESNGCYFDDDTDEWYQERSSDSVSHNNASYHSMRRHILCDLGSTPFRAGFEIEKEDGEAGLINYSILYDATYWVKEGDGSLDSRTGYELISPTYPLFTNDLDKIIEDNEDLRTLINADFSDRCGGHINLSAQNYNPEQLFEGLSGFFPLLYAMYEHRLGGGYCQAKKKHQYYGKDKYSAVFIKDQLIEFRIFPAVRSVRNLIWRRDLIRIMCNNINKDEIAVVKMMSSPTSPLYRHLRKVFSQEQIIRKIGMFVEYADIYCNKKIDIPKKNVDNLKAKKDRFPDVNDVSDGLGA